MDDWAKQFKSLLSSPLGVEMLRSIKEDLHDSIIADAQKAKTQEDAFGLLKEASGVIKVVEHLQFRTVTPKAGGSKVKN